MNAWSWVSLAIFALKEVAAHTRYTGDDKLATEIEALVDSIRSVAGTPVTKAQLEKISIEGGYRRPN